MSGWRFDSEVTGVFDDMLERSIPQYELMRATVFEVASRFMRQSMNPYVVDIGCSTGGAIEDLSSTFKSADFLGIDASKPMFDEAGRRFSGKDNVEICQADLREFSVEELAGKKATVVLSVLTLQFTPIEYRPDIVGSVFDTLDSGGGFVVVEKVIGESPWTNRMFTESYHASKKRNGYDSEEIQRKALALEGVLVSQTAKANLDMLVGAGFRPVECFWRWMNFAGWVAVKP